MNRASVERLKYRIIVTAAKYQLRNITSKKRMNETPRVFDSS